VQQENCFGDNQTRTKADSHREEEKKRVKKKRAPSLRHEIFDGHKTDSPWPPNERDIFTKTETKRQFHAGKK
jgi:hypothetical protein